MKALLELKIHLPRYLRRQLWSVGGRKKAIEERRLTVRRDISIAVFDDMISYFGTSPRVSILRLFTHQKRRRVERLQKLSKSKSHRGTFLPFKNYWMSSLFWEIQPLLLGANLRQAVVVPLS